VSKLTSEVGSNTLKRIQHPFSGKIISYTNSESGITIKLVSKKTVAIKVAKKGPQRRVQRDCSNLFFIQHGEIEDSGIFLKMIDKKATISATGLIID
jgi:hypothetical protein